MEASADESGQPFGALQFPQACGEASDTDIRQHCLVRAEQLEDPEPLHEPVVAHDLLEIELLNDVPDHDN